MSTTLTYGRKKPVSGDVGTTIYSALEGNIDLDDAHDHNGTNSAQLTASAFALTTQSILAASWVAVGSGTYRQLVTLPGTLTYDGIMIEFRDATTGARLYLHHIKNAASTYYVYTNDNTLAITAIYV